MTTSHAFSLVGGPFHRLLCRTRLVRGGTDTTRVGLTLGWSLWMGLLAMASLDGVTGEIFSLSKASAHVRLLVVIPLFFFAESLVAPRVAHFLRALVTSGIVPPAAKSAFDATVTRVSRWLDSWTLDLLALTAAVVAALVAKHLPVVGATAGAHPGQTPLSTVIFWYWAGCLTLFRFLLFRWLLRLGIWAYLLWHISRLDLHLVPSHPDRVAGLGGVELVQLHFAPLAMAISAVQSASLAEELSTGSMSFSAIGPAIAFVVIADVVLFVGPVLAFLDVLWRAKVTGLGTYMPFASRYVSAFDRKWLHGETTDEVLGTPDLQSLADLNNSVMVVRSMRTVLASRRMFVTLSIAAIVPMLPLLLFEYPLTDLARTFITRLTGL